MKKIMFNDKYRLTAAVLNGKKTMTRRIVKNANLLQWLNELDDDGAIRTIKCTILSEENSAYKVGEIVAVAMAYKEIRLNFAQYQDLTFKKKHVAQWGNTRSMKGWSNKMYVRADLMPHHIRITDIKAERLQDISEEDVYKEGFTHEFVNNNWGNSAYHEETMLVYYDNKGLTKQIRSREPKEAFSFLIDKVSGNGTWDRNPWVFVYTFELID